MNTKQKPITHVSKGDILVVPSTGGPKQWVVFDVKPHDSLQGYVSVRFSYDEVEPVDDGKGGTKIVSKITNAMAFSNRDNFQVIVT